MSLAMFAGCFDSGSDTEVGGNSNAGVSDGNNEGGAVSNEDVSTGAVVFKDYDSLPESVKAIKMGTVNPGGYVTPSRGGIYYQDSTTKKYGVMSHDGKSDTGAKYDHCDSEEEYFTVMTTSPTDYTDIDSLNKAGVIDGHGKVLVPEEYSTITVLNDRYAQVVKVTEQTQNKEEALVYYTESMFSISASDDDILFKGTWYIYDMVAGKVLDGATGTKAYSASAKGNYVIYTTDDSQRFTVNGDGEPLPEGAYLLDDGSYKIVEGNQGVLYDTEGKKMFTYALDGYVPENCEDGYYRCTKRQDGKTTTVYMDKTGKVISGEFPGYATLYGKLVHCEEQVYDLSGKLVLDGTYKYMYWEDSFDNIWALRNGDEYTFIKADGTVLLKGTQAADYSLVIDSYDFVSYQKTADGDYMYYSFKDKDYTINGSSCAPLLVDMKKANGIYDLVYTISGESILNGYSNYTAYTDGLVYYIYAKSASGEVDIYAIQ